MRKSNIRKCTRWISVLLCAVLTFSILGCGGDAQTQPTATPAPTTDMDKVGGNNLPVSGGSINIVMPANPASLNPLEANARELVDVFGLIYDSLVRYDESMRPLPGLAERWSLSPDGLTWTFNLRKDAVFHNDKALTAQDVVYTLDQLAAIKSDPQKASLYTDVLDLIASYTAVDTNTLTITTKRKSARLLHGLTFPVLQSGTASTTSVAPGTGAYRVSNYEAGKQMELTANTKWWRHTPYITTIIAKAMPDPDTALTSMNVRLVDVVHTSSLTANSYKQQGVVNVYELMTQEYECIVPNLRHAVMNDARMRTAIIEALDRKTIITEAYLTHAVSSDVPIPPDSYLYDQTHTQHAYNPARAQELLSEMGYRDTDGDGFVEKDGQKLTLKVIVNENKLNTARADAARMAKDQLKAVGIDCEISTLDWTTYTAKLKNGDFDLAFAGFSIGNDGDLSFMVSSGASHNYSGYVSSTMDGYLNAYIEATEETAIVAAASDVQKLFATDLPLISLYFRTNSLVCSAAVQGICNSRNMEVYKAIEQWFLLREEDENKAATPQ